MIRRLDENDRERLIALLERSPVYNLYLLSNLHQLGFDSDYCEFYGDITDTGWLSGVVNRYMSGWSVYGAPGADWAGLANVIDQYADDAKRLQDNPGGVASILPHIRTYDAERVSQEELMTLYKSDFVHVPPTDAYTVRRASQADLPQLIDFYASAEDMSRAASAVERPLRDLRIFVAATGSAIVSAALTNAEVDHAAMIGGVYTLPTERGRGLAAAVCSALCAELLAENKQPALYWQSPAAGAVYRRLGFRAIGAWRSVWLRRCT